jgi:hypothetical protein
MPTDQLLNNWAIAVQDDDLNTLVDMSSLPDRQLIRMITDANEPFNRSNSAIHELACRANNMCLTVAAYIRLKIKSSPA